MLVTLSAISCKSQFLILKLHSISTTRPSLIFLLQLSKCFGKHTESIFHCGVSNLNQAKLSHFFVLINLRSEINQHILYLFCFSSSSKSSKSRSKDLLLIYSSSHASGCIETKSHKNSFSSSNLCSIVITLAFLNWNFEIFQFSDHQPAIENKSICQEILDFCFSFAYAVISSTLASASLLSHIESSAHEEISASIFFLFKNFTSILDNKSSISL